MRHFELKVHIAAPSRVRDDARWVEIAENIANFKPARQVHPGDSNVNTTQGHSEDEALDELSASTPAISVSSGSLPSVSSPAKGRRKAEHETSTASNRVRPVPRKRVANPDFTSHSVSAKRTKRTSFARAKKGLNPAFGNPIAGYLKTSKEAAETPQARTAPETTVLVPFTISPKAGRALSDDISLADSRSCDSFVESWSNSRVDETSFVDDSSEACESLEVRPFVLHGTISENYSFDKCIYPGNQEQLLSSDSFTQTSRSEKGMKRRVSQASFHESHVEMGTRHIEYDVSIADRLSQHTNSDRSHLPTSSASTETASDPTLYHNYSSLLAPRSVLTPTPVIDLTTDLEESTPQVTRRDVLGPVSSPLHDCDPSSEASEHVPTTGQYLTMIRTLPRHINCRVLNTIENKPFTTVIPEYLRNLAEKFDLVNHFYPVHALTPIGNTSRGYWRLLIRITDIGTVTKARRSPLTSSQWSDRRFMLRQAGHIPEPASTSEGDTVLKALVYPPTDPGTLTPWTVDEFTEFWDYLAKVIERGRAGHDVTASFESSNTSKDSGPKLEARLYGWGGSLSHLWLVLYGVSSGLTARMPLQWLGPGKGALVTMSGQPRRGGAMGRWIEQESGKKGYWGFERAWEGLDTDASSSQQH